MQPIHLLSRTLIPFYFGLTIRFMKFKQTPVPRTIFQVRSHQKLTPQHRTRLENSLHVDQLQFFKRPSELSMYEYIVSCEGGYKTAEGKGYGVQVYVSEKLKIPPVVLMTNPKFRHIMVEFGTGRLLFPGINTISEWKSNPLSLQNLLLSVKKWIQLKLPNDFEELVKLNVYPLNLQMWGHFTQQNTAKFYSEVDKNKEEE